KLVVVGAVGV
nr:Chain C, MM96 [Schaalia radingae]